MNQLSQPLRLRHRLAHPKQLAADLRALRRRACLRAAARVARRAPAQPARLRCLGLAAFLARLALLVVLVPQSDRFLVVDSEKKLNRGAASGELRGHGELPSCDGGALECV